jgi:hypothetical protein
LHTICTQIIELPYLNLLLHFGNNSFLLTVFLCFSSIKIKIEPPNRIKFFHQMIVKIQTVEMENNWLWEVREQLFSFQWHGEPSIKVD